MRKFCNLLFGLLGLLGARQSCSRLQTNHPCRMLGDASFRTSRFPRPRQQSPLLAPSVGGLAQPWLKVIVPVLIVPKRILPVQCIQKWYGRLQLFKMSSGKCLCVAAGPALGIIAWRAFSNSYRCVHQLGLHKWLAIHMFAHLQCHGLVLVRYPSLMH